jgi:hypothetical protein
MKNAVVYEGDKCFIQVTNAATGVISRIQVDPADLPVLLNHSWQVNNTGYARTTQKANGKFFTTYMHRFLTECPEDLVVNHRDFNRLNNTRANMEVCSQMHNLLHNHGKGIRRNSSGHCSAQVGIGGGEVRLGTFPTEEEARAAYNAAKSILRSLPIRYTDEELQLAILEVKKLKSTHPHAAPRTTGKKGYAKDPKSGKYYARLMRNGKLHHLGGFYTEEEARQAYLEAKGVFNVGGCQMQNTGVSSSC